VGFTHGLNARDAMLVNPPSIEQRLALRRRPSRGAVMFQRWSELLFVHWEIEAARIQAMLPPGLFVDTFGGRAFVGVVPFYMQRVRPAWLPCVPGISDFLELNVRTYVHDEQGRPGVWFFSLDCNQPLAVWIARRFFALPYFHARMSAARGSDGLIHYRSERRNADADFTCTYGFEGDAFTAEPGTLEFFLVERYLLFANRPRGLFSGQVHHSPYPLRQVKSLRFEGGLLDAQGFPSSEAPAHIIGSPGVKVEIFALKRAA